MDLSVSKMVTQNDCKFIVAIFDRFRMYLSYVTALHTHTRTHKHRYTVGLGFEVDGTPLYGIMH